MKLVQILSLVLFLFIFAAIAHAYDGRVLVLKGRVFTDTNKNTVYDDGEPGFPGILVTPLDNAIDYTGQLLRPQYTNQDGIIVWDGLMERITYRFNYSNPKGYYFENYDIGLKCHPGKECISDPEPTDDYKGSIIVQNLSGFEVPLIPNSLAVANTSLLCLKISMDLGIPPSPPTTDTSGSYSTASSSTQYGGVSMQVGVSGMAYLDSNQNSMLDDEELNSGISGLTVYITPNQQGANGNRINQPVISKTGGIWSIGNLKSNTYYSLTFSNPKDFKIGDLNENNICDDCLHAPTASERPIDAVYVQTLESYKVPLIYSPGTPAGSQNVTLSTFVTVFGSLTGSATSTGGSSPTRPPYQPPMFGVAIFGLFFRDDSNDGILNNNEKGVSGVKAEIYEDGDPVPSGFSRDPIKPNPAFSQANGVFTFDDLVPGREYQLKLYNPKGYAFGNIIPDYSCNNCIKKSQTSDGLKAKYYFTLPAWQIPLVPFSSIDEGEQYINVAIYVPTNIEPPATPSPTPTPSKTPTPTPTPSKTPSPTTNPNFTGSALIGNMFIDSSGNGEKEMTESWYAGLKIMLYDVNKNPAKDASGKPVQPSITDANGRFIFENIAPGNYSIKIIDGLKGVYDPGFIGQFQIDQGGTPSSDNDNIQSPTYINLGGYGLFPTGSSSCSGVVFDDVNFNNIFDINIDKVLVGIIINIYAPVYGYLINTVTTGADGRWTCNGLTRGVNYRCDFDQKGGRISTGLPPRRFITGGQNDVNYGSANAQNNQGMVNSNNPSAFITTCFVRGSRVGAYKEETAVIRFTANATGQAYRGDGMKYMTKMAKHSQVGSVYGVTYRPETGDTFVSAFFKAGCDFGPSGTGAIYRIDKNLQTTTWVDLNEMFGSNFTGPYIAPWVINVTNTPPAASFVGKNSLGDLQSNNQFLFVSNLYNNQVIQIPWTTKPTLANTVKITVPNPGCTFAEDWRIYGLQFHMGEFYVGGVCTGEKGSALTAYVLRFNPNDNNKWITVLQFALTYPRGCRTGVSCVPTKWFKWDSNPGATQAMLGSIHFDDYGRLIIGLKDRGTDMTTRVAGPDMLIACPTSNGFFQLESKGVCGGRTGALPKAISYDKRPFGPGGGQYFQVQNKYHDYTVAFGMTKGGPDQVVVTGYDYYGIVEGAVRWFNTTTGKIIKAYGVYNTTLQPYTLSKANGLGDIAPVFPASMNVWECGRVWNDLNCNGIQDCNEPGLQNIKVFLFLKDNPACPVAYAFTDQNGYFKFSVLPGKQYYCLIYSTEVKEKFGEFLLSPTLTDPRYEGIDSDAILVNGNLVTNFLAQPTSGYSYSLCHFGIRKSTVVPTKGGYGHWRWRYGGHHGGFNRDDSSDDNRGPSSVSSSGSNSGYSSGFNHRGDSSDDNHRYSGRGDSTGYNHRGDSDDHRRYSGGGGGYDRRGDSSDDNRRYSGGGYDHRRW